MKHIKRAATNPLQPNPSEYCVVDGKKKRKYASEIEAELSSPARELHQYICQHCNSWHNGKSSRPVPNELDF